MSIVVKEPNFLVKQYDDHAKYAMNHNYLSDQFSDYSVILDKIAEVVRVGDFTLGEAVNRFESEICQLTGSRYCIGVGSGTDALMLSLIAAGVSHGDEVITTPYTFYATIGAIVSCGATPVFVDVCQDYNIDPKKIPAAITSKAKAILPVHWSGSACQMDPLVDIATQYNLAIVEDACHGINASYKGKALGRFGAAGCFSMHPLKNLNVWGDGGYIITDDDEMHTQLHLLRNHGLINRNECQLFGFNSRLDTIQAVVGSHLLTKIDMITDTRIRNAGRYDQGFHAVSQVYIPPRPDDVKQVFHIYVIQVQRRDELVAHLQSCGVDAKVHYPIPMHLQLAARPYGYQRGDFPVCEAICDSVLSLPVHEFITDEQIDHVIRVIKDFYA